MRAQPMLPTHIASDDGKLPSGRQGREGRDFLSALKQASYRNFHIHERRPRACVHVGKNNGDVFSRRSRPSSAVGDQRSAHSAVWPHPPVVLLSHRGRRQAISDTTIEVKRRANGFARLYDWLNDRDVLIRKADRQEPLVVLRLSLAAKIAKPAVGTCTERDKGRAV